MVKIKEVNGVYYHESDGVFLPITERVSSREKSWITIHQITTEFPEFFDKIEEIFTKTEPTYNDKAKDYAANISEYLEKFGHLSWKQFDSVWGICSTYDDYINGKRKGYFQFGSVVSVKARGVQFTTHELREPTIAFSTLSDRQMDKLHKRLFGTRPIFQEELEEGYSVAYRDDGSRYFALPTGDERLEDYIDIFNC